MTRSTAGSRASHGRPVRGPRRRAPPRRASRAESRAAAAAAGEGDVFERRTMAWLRRCVIGKELCPFAEPALPTTRCVSSLAAGKEDILLEVEREARSLVEGSQRRRGAAGAQHATTTLLVLPIGAHAEDFGEFMEIVSLGEQVVEASGLGSDVQLVPFHPRAVFDDNVALRGGRDAYRRSDPADYTARSPYPCIHFLLEREVSAALDGFKRQGKSTSHHIIDRNKRALRALGNEALHRSFVEEIFDDEDADGDGAPTAM